MPISQLVWFLSLPIKLRFASAEMNRMSLKTKSVINKSSLWELQRFNTKPVCMYEWTVLFCTRLWCHAEVGFVHNFFLQAYACLCILFIFSFIVCQVRTSCFFFLFYFLRHCLRMHTFKDHSWHLNKYKNLKVQKFISNQ